MKHVTRRKRPYGNKWVTGAVRAVRAVKSLRKGYGVYQRGKKVYNYARNIANRAYRGVRGNLGGKKRALKVPLDNVHSGVNIDHARVHLHDYPKLGTSQKWAGTWTYTQTHQHHLTSNPGRQGITVIASGVTKEQCVTSTGPAYTVYQNNTCLEQLNPNLTNTGSAFLGSVVTPLNDRFFVHNGDVEINLTNFSGGSTLCELYLVTAKKANSSDPVGHWNQGYIDDGYGKTVFSQPAIGSTGGQVTGSGNAGFVGCTPTETSLFRSMWKVHHRHKFEIAGGASYQHSIHIDINKIIKKNDLAQLAGTWITGTSYSIFLVHRGVVGLDTPDTGPTIANTYPIFIPTELGVVVNVKTRCQAIAGNAARLPVAMYSNEVATGAYNPTNLAKIQVMNIVDNPERINTMVCEDG